MSGISGLIYGDPARPIPRQARKTLGADLPVEGGTGAVTGPGFMFLPLGATASAEQLADAVALADLDISNLNDLLASTGAGSPAQALAQLYRRDTITFPNCLRGAFAVALWLPREHRLLLAGDRFGFRRIYYTATAEAVAFSPRLGGVHRLAPLNADLDLNAVYAYMNFGTVPAPQSMYRSIRRLPPGHRLIWQDGHLTVEPYWDVRYTEESRSHPAAAIAVFRHTEDAVRQALMGADLKSTGAFLSGGTDSSTVLGLMTRLTEERVHAFSIGFREERYNELAYAELAARHFSAAHYSHLVTPDEAFACLPDLITAYDEPFGNNSAIPTYLCARLAKDAGMQLLLAGDGGDEIFGGNERYRREQILARYGRIPGPLRRGLIEPVLRACPPGGRTLLGKAQRYVARASRPNPDRFYSSEFFVTEQRTRLLHPDFLHAIQWDWPLAVASRHYRAARASAELNRLLYVDLKITLGDNDLFKVTRAAELAGIAVRFPMLDHPLVEFTATLPVRDKVRGSEKRYLFKRAFASLLPRQVLTKTKHGFGLPVSDWLKTHRLFHDLARDTLLSNRCLQRGYLAPGSVESLLRLHAEDTTPYYGDMLWTLLMLELWHRRFEAN